MAYLGNSPLSRLFSAQTAILSQGQTAVLMNYAPGMTLFVKNGAILEDGDYTATDGSVVTLTNPANEGDVLRGLSFGQFAVANALPLSGGTLSGQLNGPRSAYESVAGLVKLSTTLLAQGLVDDTTALTPKKLADAFKGSNQLLAANGYQKLPGGLIIQWGSVNVPAGSTGSFTLPIAYPIQQVAASIAPDSWPYTWASQPFYAISAATQTYLNVSTLYGASNSSVRVISLGY